MVEEAARLVLVAELGVDDASDSSLAAGRMNALAGPGDITDMDVLGTCGEIGGVVGTGEESESPLRETPRGFAGPKGLRDLGGSPPANSSDQLLQRE